MWILLKSGIVAPLVLLALLVLMSPNRRLAAAAIILGILLDFSLLYIYVLADGDMLAQLISPLAMGLMFPGIVGVLCGFLPLMPLININIASALPIITAFATAGYGGILFFSTRMLLFSVDYDGLWISASVFGIAFSVGVLLHVMASVAVSTPVAPRPPI